jgi:hypothetical protein
MQVLELSTRAVRNDSLKRLSAVIIASVKKIVLELNRQHQPSHMFISSPYWTELLKFPVLCP